MVALALRPSLWIAAVLVGAFAIFRGRARHGVAPGRKPARLRRRIRGRDRPAAPLYFSIGLSLLARWPVGVRAVRIGGGLIACAGLYVLTTV